MSRLTARTETGHAYLVNVKPDEQEVDSPYKNTLQCILDCFERLAQYEDTGMEPKEIKDNMEIFHSYRHICAGIDPDRLRELVEADRDGRVVIRPDCRTCAHRSLIKYHSQCFGCLGQDRFGMEKGNNYQPRTKAEAALAGQEDKP